MDLVTVLLCGDNDWTEVIDQAMEVSYKKGRRLSDVTVSSRLQ